MGNIKELGNISNRIPIDIGKQLAEKYGVLDKLLIIFDFNPSEDPVGTKPIPKKLRAKMSSGELEQLSRTPVRSRAPSEVTPANSPSRLIMKQEPTPMHREFTRERQFTLPTVLSKRSFDENNARKEFFESVYSRKRSRTTDSLTPLEPMELIIPDPIKIDDQKTLLINIFVNEDTDYNCQLFEQMLKSFGRNVENMQLQLGEKKGTLLHWAAAYSRVKLVQLFIEKGNQG